MLTATGHTPRTGVSVHELSPRVSRLIVLAGLALFWGSVGLMILALS